MIVGGRVWVMKHWMRHDISINLMVIWGSQSYKSTRNQEEGIHIRTWKIKSVEFKKIFVKLRVAVSNSKQGLRLLFADLTWWQWKFPFFNRRYNFKRSTFCCHVSLLEGTGYCNNSWFSGVDCFHFFRATIFFRGPRFFSLNHEDLERSWVVGWGTHVVISLWWITNMNHQALLDHPTLSLGQGVIWGLRRETLVHSGKIKSIPCSFLRRAL